MNLQEMMSAYGKEKKSNLKKKSKKIPVFEPEEQEQITMAEEENIEDIIRFDINQVMKENKHLSDTIVDDIQIQKYQIDDIPSEIMHINKEQEQQERKLDEEKLEEDLEDQEEEVEDQEEMEEVDTNEILQDDEDEDTDEDESDTYLQKFQKELHHKYLETIHPECVKHNYNEVRVLSQVVRDENKQIVDHTHRTLPYLTKYEKTRVIGQRAKQINKGASPFIEVDSKIIDGYVIAELELYARKIPFIIRRPLPGGGSEYWNLSDLEII